jgi:glutamate dehydrogenase (NAD(P)+)
VSKRYVTSKSALNKVQIMMLSRQVVPPFFFEIEDASLGLIGYLAIDSTVNNRSAGGIRMLPDVSSNEVIYLARNMTLKHGFWNIPIGGAKSCLLVSDAWPRKVRDKYLSAFGRILAPLIKSNKYAIGLDMGTSKVDLEHIYAASGFLRSVGDPRSHIHTAWTVLAAAEVAAKRVSLSLPTCSIAIEGFGKVGKAVAEMFSYLGANIVAVSTSEGAIYDSAGLDISELVKLSQAFGDKLTLRYTAKKITNHDLLCLPVDILIPCARPWSINPSNVGEIRAKIICPGANLPLSTEMEKILNRKGVLCIPDLIANSGGVLGIYMEPITGERKMKAIMQKDLAKQLRHVLQLAQETNVTPSLIARQIALHRFNLTKQRAEHDILERRFIKSGLRLLPKGLRRIFAPLYLRRPKSSSARAFP